MKNTILYGDNTLSKKLNKKDNFLGISYHKNKNFFIPNKNKKKLSDNKKLNFLITVKEPNDRAAYELLRLKFRKAKIFNIKNVEFNENNKIKIYRYFKEINKLKKLINKHDVISFDLFETIIDKNLSSSSDIYNLVNLELKNKKYNSYRYLIEKELVNETKFNFSYKNLLIKLKRKIKCSDDYLKKIKKLEERVEISNCFIKKEILELIKYAKKRRKNNSYI